MIIMTTIVSTQEEHPELGFTDAQVEAGGAKKLNPEDKKFYEEYRDYLDALTIISMAGSSKCQTS